MGELTFNPKTNYSTYRAGTALTAPSSFSTCCSKISVLMASNPNGFWLLKTYMAEDLPLEKVVIAFFSS